MAAVAFKNKHLGRSLHLGFRPSPPERRMKVVRMADYFNPQHAAVLPTSVDYTAVALKSFLQMLGNNQQGDCTIAAVLKQVGIASANRPDPKELVSSDVEALQQYPVICGRGDNGCNIPDVMDHWRDKGLRVGGKLTKIAGYASIDPTDELLCNTCLYLFSSIHLGFLLTQTQYENAAPDYVWTDDGSPIVGGHSVPFAGFDPSRYTLGTWGWKQFMTRAAVESPRSQSELYVALSEEWTNTAGMSAHGIDVAALSAALATVAGGGTPPIPDPPRPPSPPPPPAPGGDELLSLSGTMTLHGQTYPVGVVLSLLASSPNPTAVNFLKLLADIAALMSAVVSKNWAAAAAAIATILADLGLTMSAAQRSQIMAALATADAQYGPTQALKAAAAAVRDNTNGN